MEAAPFNSGTTSSLNTVGTTSYTTSTSPVVNYVEAAPSAYAEKAKLREHKFLSGEISRETKLLAREEKKEAKYSEKSERHAEKADRLSAKGWSWRASRHEEKAMKFRSQASYHQHIAAEAQQSISRAEMMQAMPVVYVTPAQTSAILDTFVLTTHCRGAVVPVGTTTQVQTVETPLYSQTTRL